MSAWTAADITGLRIDNATDDEQSTDAWSAATASTLREMPKESKVCHPSRYAMVQHITCPVRLLERGEPETLPRCP